MSEPFIITGLPRSRTAWLSAVCNTVPEAICHHEPLATMDDWRGVVGLLSNARYRYAGASDSTLSLHLADLVRLIQPRVLVVSRSLADVHASLRAIMPDAPHCRLLQIMQDRLSFARGEPSILVMQYEELTRVRRVCAALSHLMPGASICPEKVAEMQRMNVQADLDLAKRQADECLAAGRLSGIFGADVVAELRA